MAVLQKAADARSTGIAGWGVFTCWKWPLGSIAGFALATVSERGPPTHLGFGMSPVLWLFSGLAAYRLVRGELPPRRQWMIHNFALTLAAVTLRNYMPLPTFAQHWRPSKLQHRDFDRAPLFLIRSHLLAQRIFVRF